MVIIFVTSGTNFLLPPFLYSKASLLLSSCSPCTNKKILMHSLCKILSFVTFAKSVPKGLARLNKCTNKLRCQPRALLANWVCTIALFPKPPLHTWDTLRWDCRGGVCPGKLLILSGGSQLGKQSPLWRLEQSHRQYCLSPLQRQTLPSFKFLSFFFWATFLMLSILFHLCYVL